MADRAELIPICDNNFSSHLQPLRNAVLFFKSDNCQYCKMMYPAVEASAHKYRHRAFWGVVDVPRCPETTAFFKVPSYPYLLYVRYRDTAVSTPENMRAPAFLKHVLGYPSRHVQSFREVQDEAERNRSFFLIDHELSAAEELGIDELTINHTFLTIDSFRNLPLKFDTKIVFYRNVDRQFISIGNELSADRLKKFLLNGTRAGFIEFSSDRVNEFTIEDRFLILVKFEISRDALGNDQFIFLTSIADLNVPVFYFPLEQASVFNDLLNPPNDQETVIGVLKIVGGISQRWIYTDFKRTPRDFVIAVLKGEVPLYFKSEEPPKGNSGPVKKVVGSTYRQIVDRSTLPFVLLLHTGEREETDAYVATLEAAALQFRKRAAFGHLNVEANEITVERPPHLPAFVLIWNGKATLCEQDAPALTEWLRQVLDRVDL
jgi:hypothetical protein